MKKHSGYYIIVLLALMAINFTSCKKKEVKDDYADVKGNYFSIFQYGLDSWNNFSGAPFVIVKTVRVDNGKPDSSFSNSDTVSWAPIFLTFFATDISDRKYLGQYNFNQFDDDQDNTHNFFYMAKEPDMYTQKLLITIDKETNKVRGIYIETFEKTALKETTKKLYYNPMKTIQIQTYTKPLWSKQTHVVQQWDFMI